MSWELLGKRGNKMKDVTEIEGTGTAHVSTVNGGAKGDLWRSGWKWRKAVLLLMGDRLWSCPWVSIGVSWLCLGYSAVMCHMGKGEGKSQKKRQRQKEGHRS